MPIVRQANKHREWRFSLMQYKGLDIHIKHVLIEKAITPDTRLPVDHSNQYVIHADDLGNGETYTNKSNAYNLLNFLNHTDFLQSVYLFHVADIDLWHRYFPVWLFSQCRLFSISRAFTSGAKRLIWFGGPLSSPDTTWAWCGLQLWHSQRNIFPAAYFTRLPDIMAWIGNHRSYCAMRCHHLCIL